MDVTATTTSADEDESGDQNESNKKLPSSKYKGVVPQPNGRWGAQIYEKHQRVWLGTFNSQEEAAEVYDIAATKFRGQNAITNVRTCEDQETVFLKSHSKNEIVDMLRKHTYKQELEESKQQMMYYGTRSVGIFKEKSQGKEFLFEKVVTPSDVGKLNRMVIPKQQAEKHFGFNGESASKGVLLNFEDEVGKVWRLRYCYWSSSQSFVLTKGWSKFVKEKGLKAGDLVCFWRSNGGGHWGSKLYIECRFAGGGSGSDRTENEVAVAVEEEEEEESGNGSGGSGGGSGVGGSVVRLFGVDILHGPDNYVQGDY